MASIARIVISRGREHSSSATTATSTSTSRSGKSFGSWGQRRPLDSPEKTRERVNTAITSHRAWHASSNVSIQVEADTETEEEVQSGVLVIPRPPISRNTVCERYPKGRASALVFVLNAIAIYAYGAAITGIIDIFSIQNEDENTNTRLRHESIHFVKLLFQFCVSRVFYPLTGFVGDVYIGRWRMIHTSILLLLTGYVIIVISFTLEAHSSVNLNFYTGNAINVVAFIFLSIGGGAFEATMIPFGVDQLQGASSADIFTSSTSVVIWGW